MFRIRKLYTEPAVIDAVEFFDGVNLILGVEDKSSNKTNGVGKSLSIEFINFALLASKNKSRVRYIPEGVFPKSTEICLDIEISGERFTIKRSIENADRPKLISGDEVVSFSKVEDATKFLGEKLFLSTDKRTPSFRAMMGPLIRDERSEFKSIISCYDTSERVPDDYSPHLYLLGIDIEIYDAIRFANNQIDDLTKDIKKIRDNVKLLRQKEIEDARSDLNELDSEVEEIERSIDELENVSGYELVKNDIIELENKIENLRREKSLLAQRLARTKLITEGPRIDSDEIGEFFELISNRLGTLVKKDLEEVYRFKDTIDEYQNQLIREQRQLFEKEISALNKQISALDDVYKKKLTLLDQQGALKNLKQTYSAFQSKAEEASQLRAFIDRFEELESQKQKTKSEKETDLLKLQSDIQEAKRTLKSFEKTILKIHDYVQGNKKASFDIKPTSKKQVVEIIMRIDDDGGHSVEREKVFIYDVALLINEETSVRHPGLLIHDNIFDVDQDTLVKSVEYLVHEATFDKQQQYILTLNSDRLDAKTKLILEPYTRAKFTKQRRFLKSKYQEIH